MMQDKSSYSAKVLKKTLRMFMLMAVVLAGASIGISRLFTEDVVLMAEKTSRENLNILWDSYQHYYMSAGRVRRPKNQMDTVSEGQAYAMLRAVWLRDRAGFDAAYQWTEENLSRLRSNGDHLLSWRYGSGALGSPAVIDQTPALDADLDYALALFLASRIWTDGKSPTGTMPYRDKGLAVAENIMQKGVLIHPNGEFVMLPWPMEDTRSPDRDILINPSYFSPGHYRVFAVETGDPRWTRLADDTYNIVNRLLESQGARGDQVAAIPDWIVMRPNGGFATDPDRGYVSGWDAFRIWWRIRLDYDICGNPRARDILTTHLVRFLNKSMTESGGEVASESNRDGSPVNKWTNSGMAAAYGWALREFEPALSRSLQRQAVRRLQREGEFMYFQDKEDYYTNSWAWFSMAEGDMQFPFVGLYRIDIGTGTDTGGSGGRP